MPDWIVHLGATHAAVRPLARLDPRWLLLGAVLPDAVPRPVGVLLAKVSALEPLATVETGLWLGFLHTPFSVALLIAALAAVAAERSRAVLALGAGAGLHFALDVLQRSFGGGTSLGYPVWLQPVSVQAVWYESPATAAVVAACAVYLVVLVRRGARPVSPTLRRPRAPAAIAAVLLAGGYLLSPVLALDAAIAGNVHGALLAREPERFLGRPIELSVASVEHVDAAGIVVEKSEAEIRVLWPAAPVVPGQFVSARGVLTARGLEPGEVFVHAVGYKSVLSLAGAAVVVWCWWPSLRRRPRARPAAARPEGRALHAD